MSWWRNNDSRDDDNEKEIKFILALSYVAIVLAGALVFMFTLAGCTHRLEEFNCRCNCNGESTLECTATELKTKIDGR